MNAETKKIIEQLTDRQMFILKQLLNGPNQALTDEYLSIQDTKNKLKASKI